MTREQFQQLPDDVKYLIFHGIVNPKKPDEVAAALSKAAKEKT